MRLFPAQKLIALALIIFLSETCCALCCGTMQVAALAMAKSCPMSKQHHCPKAEKPDAPNVAGQIAAYTDSTKRFCPFISKRGDATKNDYFEFKFSNASPVKLLSPSKVFLAGQAFTVDKTYRSLVRNRGSTYLANCVFRI